MPVELPIEEILAGEAREAPPDRALEIGRSRQDRPIQGYRFGHGGCHVSLLAGSHADEPVGPALLRRLAGWLAHRPATAPELTEATWSLIPHVNPDGEAANAGWIGQTVALKDHTGTDDLGYELAAYLKHVVREAPGDDIEWGYPEVSDLGADDDLGAVRPENLAVARFLAAGAPFALHASLHGMGFAEGPWFLLEPAWIERTEGLRAHLETLVGELGYALHDVDRHGEKGFRRIGPGYSTRPDSRAMAAYFIERGEAETAALFGPSSMELVRELGDDPLTLVSEMPLFLVPGATDEVAEGGPPSPSGTDGRRHFFAWAAERLRRVTPETFRFEAARAGIRPMPIRDQMRLQLAFVNQGLAAVAAASTGDEEE
ncbi:MAG: peptidase [Acidobacteria bacterium]|nr:peptidase [Acidobacteriota bacterium]